MLLTCSDDVDSSGFLSSRTRISRGNRREMPFSKTNEIRWWRKQLIDCVYYKNKSISYIQSTLSGSTMPTAARWTGLMVKSAAFTSQTWKTITHHMHEKELHICEFTTIIQIITGVIILQFFGIFLKTQIKIQKLFLIFSLIFSLSSEFSTTKWRLKEKEKL